MNAQITQRKIQKVAFDHDGKLLVAEVGKPSPYNGGIVRAIYEDGTRGCYSICAGGIEIAPKEFAGGRGGLIRMSDESDWHLS